MCSEIDRDDVRRNRLVALVDTDLPAAGQTKKSGIILRLARRARPVQDKLALIGFRKNKPAEFVAQVRSRRGVTARRAVLGKIEDFDFAAERLPDQRAAARAEFLTWVGNIALARHCGPIECDELLPREGRRLLQCSRRGALRDVGRQRGADIDCNLSPREASRREADEQAQTNEFKRPLHGALLPVSKPNSSDNAEPARTVSVFRPASKLRSPARDWRLSGME